MAVIQNKLGTYCKRLMVTEGINLRQQALQGLLVHFLSVIQHSIDEQSIVWPLIGLTKRPQEFAVSNCFFSF